MIHEDHNRPGLTILPMAQDAALPFYGDVGLTDDPEEAGCFQAVFKAAILGSNFGHPQAAWETLKEPLNNSPTSATIPHTFQDDDRCS